MYVSCLTVQDLFDYLSNLTLLSIMPCLMYNNNLQNELMEDYISVN